jgi:hypothetical protein
MVLFVSTLAFGTFFIFDMPSTTLVPLGVAVYCLLLWGDITTHRELTGSVEMRFFRITRPQFKKLTTALLVAGIVFYLPHWNPDDSFFSKPNFNSIYTWAAGTANKFYPEIRFTSTVDNFVKSFAQLELKRDPRFNELTPYLQEQAFTNTSAEVLATIRKGLAIEVKVEEQVADVAYRFILTMLADWRKQFGPEFLIAWAAAVFLILRSVGVLFYLVASGAAFLAYQLLIASNFIMVIGETKVQETVQYT